MAKIGVLFDIDELGGSLYGYQAYEIFFAAVDTSQLAACLLSDGDTNATLFGNARQYCIALESLLDDKQIDYVRNALAACPAKGLLPLSSRFLVDSEVVREPLVLCGRIDATGKLVDCNTGWVREAWQKSREQHALRPEAAQAAPVLGFSGAAPEIVRCSSCRQEIRRHDVGIAESVPALQQWFGGVCVPCRRIYCSSCLQLGGPTPCPACGQPTKPAQRMHLQAIGALGQSPAMPTQTEAPGVSIAPLVQPSKPSMPPRERWIGILAVIVALALFEVGVQSIAPGKQSPAAAMIALQISTVLGFLGSGYVATKRGRSKVWALLGLLNWLGIIIAFCLPNRSGKNALNQADARTRATQSVLGILGPILALALVLSAGPILAAMPVSNDAADQPAAAPASLEREEVVGEISAAANLKDYSWAMQSNWLLQLQNGPRMSYAFPDGSSVLWFEHRGGHKVALLNGKQLGPEFDKGFPITPRLSADGKRLAIQGVRDKKGTIIFAEKDLLAGFDEVFNATLSPDGQKLAYGAKTGKEWSLLVNGERRAGPFDTIPSSTFSKDGAHLGYAAKRGKTWMIGLDGKEQSLGEVELLNLLVADSGRMACAAKHGHEYFYIVDGKEGPHFDILGKLVLSDNGGRYAYAGAQNKTRIVRDRAVGRLIVDGQAGPEYQGIVFNTVSDLFFSKSIWSLKEGLLPDLFSPLHGISDPVFSPDAQHLAHSVHLSEETTAVLLDDHPVAKFNGTGMAVLSFSPDGKRLAALGWRGQKLVEVRGDATFAELDNPDRINIAEKLTWSPDSQRTAFVMGHGGRLYLDDKTTQARRRVVVDGKAGAEYNCALMTHLHFSPDSRHWGYEVIGDDKRKFGSFVVVDGVEGKTYDEIIPQSLRFSEGAAVYVAREGRKFVRVTRALPPGTP